MIEAFAHSDSIAVWYKLDALLGSLFKGKLEQETRDQLVSSILKKFKSLFSDFDPTKDTQLHKLVFVAACLNLRIDECVEFAKEKLLTAEVTQDL